MGVSEIDSPNKYVDLYKNFTSIKLKKEEEKKVEEKVCSKPPLINRKFGFLIK